MGADGPRQMDFWSLGFSSHAVAFFCSITSHIVTTVDIRIRHTCCKST
jgi:hypothetical protein